MSSKTVRFSNMTVRPEVAGLRDPEKNRDPSVMVVDIRGIDIALVNALRRVIPSEVETVAVPFDPMDPMTNVPNAGLLPATDKAFNNAGIWFYKNVSAQHNELLGSRIGLIPINIPENELRGYSPSKYRFRLRVKADGLDGLEDKKTGIREVTTKDIEVLDETGAKVPNTLRDSIFPPSPVTGDHIVLVRLRPGKLGGDEGEEIHVEFRARLGISKEHARWSAVSSCFHVYCKDTKRVEASITAKLEAEAVKANVDGIDKLDKKTVESIRRDHLALDAHRDFERDEEGEPSAFVFTVQSECCLRPKFLVQQGFRVLSKKVRDFANDLVASATLPLGESRVKVEKVANDDDFFKIMVDGEDHTLGNLVMGLLCLFWFGKKGNKAKALSVSYNQPHILESRIVFEIRCADPGADVRNVMVEGLVWIVNYIDEIASEWKSFAGLEDPFPLPKFRLAAAPAQVQDGGAWA